MSYVMSMGRPAAEVALYLPSSSLWLGDTAADAMFVATEQMLSERQVDFDIVNGDALAAELKAGPGTFETVSGNRYRTVIVPSASVMTQAELDRLKAFAKGGGRVLFLGSTPTMIAGRAMLDARPAKAEDLSFATVETSAQLSATPTPPAQPPTEAPVAQVVPEGIAKAVSAVVGRPEVMLDAPDTHLKVITRRLADADVYFLFNEGPQPSEHAVTMRGKGQKVEVWDAESGEVSAVASTHDGGSTTVKLALKPYETRLLVVR